MYVDGISMGVAGGGGGGGGGGRWCNHARHQSPRGSKLGSTVSILNKETDFQNFTNLKLLSRIQGNSINNCDFFKVHNF